MTTEKDNRSLMGRVLGLRTESDELYSLVLEAERQHRDEVHRLNCALTQKAAEVDELTREIERLKAQLDRPTTKGGYHINPDFKTAQPQPEAKVDGAWVIVRDTTQEFWTGHSWTDNVLLARRWSFDPSHILRGEVIAHSVFVPGLSLNRGTK
jgi:hypothetical protein